MTTKKQLDGAQALVKCLERAGVEYMFGIPGGVTIPIFDALVTTGTKIKFILTRHEQGACHMADGYARATGKPAVVCATSGPGATNTITGIMTAHMDSVPMIIVSGQVVTGMLGKDAFQEADMFGISMPMTLRPGTTATRADTALIERAMSSASPITRDDLMPGAGSSS